jgi:hypothetical protein
MGGRDRLEHLAMGETPNVAARIQGLATPNTVLLSAATYRLIAGDFACQDMGTHSLKGVSDPVQVYRVLEESAVQSRLEVVGRTGLAPLVGRDSEMTLLLERWTRSKDGLGQVVLLVGEAGIGKFRLIAALHEYVTGEGSPRITLRCSPYHMHSAPYPVIDHLQRWLQFDREDTPETKLTKLEQGLQAYRLVPENVIPLFAALLSVPPFERYPALSLSPQQ